MNVRADRKLRGAASPAIRTNSSHQPISGCVDLQTDLCEAATARPPVRIRTGRRAGPTTRDESKCQRTGDERAHGWPPSGKPRHSIGQRQGSERFGRARRGRSGDRPQPRQQLNPTERCTTSRRPSRGPSAHKIDCRISARAGYKSRPHQRHESFVAEAEPLFSVWHAAQ
jgi:hypothetical protein